jgi:hypothetical protein
VGISSVSISAYDATGAAVGSTTSASDGTYTLSIASSATDAVRVEFTTPSGYQSSFQGGSSGTSIQFVDIPATNVNFGIHQPGNYCANNNADPLVASVCMRPGSTTGLASGLRTLASTRWSNRTALNDMFTHAQTGTTWGIAQDPGTGLVWTSAVLRRHAGLGPKGLGGLYATPTSGGSVAASFDVGTLVDQGGNPILLSSDNTQYTDAARGLSNTSPLSLDVVGYEGIGQVGLGDIDFSPDGHLWVTNLYEKTVLRIKINGTPSSPTLGAVTEYAVPQNNATTCVTGGGVTTNVARPWALEFDKTSGNMLVGIVCSNDSNAVSRDSASGGGAVLSLNAGGAGTWTRLTSVAFDRQRVIESLCTNLNSFSTNNCKLAKWKAWSNDFAAILALNPPSGTELWYPQPILSDIEILEDGSIVVGIIDRFNMQMGTENRQPTDTAQNQALKTSWTSGDTQLLCKTGASTWVQEASTTGYNPSGTATTQKGGCVGVTTTGGKTYESQGWAFTRTIYEDPSNDIFIYDVPPKQQPSNNGGVEFFNDVVCNPTGADYLDGSRWNLQICPNAYVVPHYEISQGGLAVWPPTGTQELVSSAMDPDNDLFRGGLRWYSMETGDSRKGLVFNTGDNSANFSFRKSSSMGDVEMLCDQAPVQIGNRVWIDTNSNGVQDPGESPVAGVTLSLFNANNVLVGTAVTNASGEYYFSSNVTEAAAGDGDHRGGGLTAGSTFSIKLNNAANFASGGPLEGYELTSPTQSSSSSALDTSIDSNASTVSAVAQMSVPVLLSGQNDHTFDVGFVRPAVSVGDYVWWDADKDGIQDAGETGIPNVTLSITKADGSPVVDVNGQPVTTTTTDADGYYSFGKLPFGQYKVTVTPPAGYVATVANAGSDTGVDSSTGSAISRNMTVSGDRDPTLDFGFYPDDSTTGGAGSAGDGSAQSPGGGSTQNPAGVKVSVGDYVWFDSDRDGIQDRKEKPIAGVVLSITKADGSTVVDVNGKAVTTAKTDANGKYSFDNLPPGQYIVKVVPPAGFTATKAGKGSDRGRDSSTGSAMSRNMTTNGDRDPTLDFGFYRPRVSVGDVVWWDRNADGIQRSGERGIINAILTLRTPDGKQVTDVFGKVVTPKITKSDGKYRFENLPLGRYIVKITYPRGMRPTTANRSDKSLNSSSYVARSINLTRDRQHDATLDFGVLGTPEPLPATR